MGRERVKCTRCGEYLVSAQGAAGRMDEEGVLKYFKMLEELKKQGAVSDISGAARCGGCGGENFEIVQGPKPSLGG